MALWVIFDILDALAECPFFPVSDRADYLPEQSRSAICIPSALQQNGVL
jgi:hypothetical protein